MFSQFNPTTDNIQPLTPDLATNISEIETTGRPYLVMYFVFFQIKLNDVFSI